MSVPEDNGDLKVFACLKHPVRRRILRILSNGPKSYSDLLKEFRIESSHLNYHLGHLGNLLCRTEDGKYTLSNLGQAALSMMKQVEENRFISSRRPVTSEKHNKKLRLGKYSIPASVVAGLLILTISSSVLGLYLYSSFTVPTQISEPIQIVNYPSQWNLFPGETQDFTVTINNQAPLNYTVVLDFTSNDTFYQSQYMTFDGESYNVVPGQQNLDSWVNVSKDAPAENIDITVTVVRGTDTYVSPTGNQLTNGDFETGNFEGWNVTGVCSISNTIVHSGSYSAYVSDQVYDSEISQEVMLPANRDISFDGYVYPLEVGQTCGPSGSSRICFIFCNKQSMATAFSISVCWSWNTLDYYDNGTALVELLVPFNASVWNHYSLNLTSLIESYFGGFDLSQIVLFSISIYYHYSSGSPGAFYLDNLNLSA